MTHSTALQTGGSSFYVDDLHVREFKPQGQSRGVVLFIHGATVSSAMFDIQVPGYSLLAACAQAGWWSFACDLTGYGKSKRPKAMQGSPAECPVICSGQQALQDVTKVISSLQRMTGRSKLVLAGASWGSITAARYAATTGEAVERLVLLAPLFACINPGWLSQLADPLQPTRLNPALGGYRYVTEKDLLSRWDPEIPDGQTRNRRDQRVVTAIVEAELLADPQSPLKDAFRAPNGTLHDLFEVFSGRALYAPESLRMPCLLVRGADDQTSTHPDAASLAERLGTSRKDWITLPNAGHFMQAERCAPALQALLCRYLNGAGPE